MTAARLRPGAGGRPKPRALLGSPPPARAPPGQLQTRGPRRRRAAALRPLAVSAPPARRQLPRAATGSERRARACRGGEPLGAGRLREARRASGQWGRGACCSSPRDSACAAPCCPPAREAAGQVRAAAGEPPAHRAPQPGASAGAGRPRRGGALRGTTRVQAGPPPRGGCPWLYLLPHFPPEARQVFGLRSSHPSRTRWVITADVPLDSALEDAAGLRRGVACGGRGGQVFLGQPAAPRCLWSHHVACFFQDHPPIRQ